MRNRTRIISQQYFFRKAHVFASILICVVFIHLLIPDVAAKSTATPTNAPTPIKDIRILIDISGSMKKTDPNNLRRPAVKLFANLLPENVFSGVWTFGKWVNMLVPHGAADSKWKTIVHTQASNINSTGLFTNIEEVLRRATWDWKKYDPEYERTIIILSDGVVDISKNPEENNKSKSRILKDILTTLSNNKITIHTIALSSLSDKELLQQLSSATGGIYETIETTEDLDKAFMRILNTASPRDELPLIDNKVKVDESIKEITFLIFRKNKSSNTVIISPSGTKYDNKKDSDDIIWHSENRYDLVTINTPEKGTWHIDASVDPDNRVIVVTDLRLIINDIPDTILSGDIIPLYAYLESEQEIIKRQNFLHFVRMRAKYSTETENKQYSTKLKDNGKNIDDHKKDGIYSAEIKKTSAIGKYTFELFVNGTTFKRKSTQQINIVKYPAIIDINKTLNNNISISILPYQTLVDTETLEITAMHSLPDGDSEQYSVKKHSPSEWKAIIPTKDITGNHTVIIQLSGKNQKGEEINVKTEPDNIIIGNKEQKNMRQNPEKTPINITDETNKNETTSWLNVVLSVLSFNIILILLIFSLYKLWRKYRYILLPPPGEEMANA